MSEIPGMPPIPSNPVPSIPAVEPTPPMPYGAAPAIPAAPMPNETNALPNNDPAAAPKVPHLQSNMFKMQRNKSKTDM